MSQVKELSSNQMFSRKPATHIIVNCSPIHFKNLFFYIFPFITLHYLHFPMSLYGKILDIDFVRYGPIQLNSNHFLFHRTVAENI